MSLVLCVGLKLTTLPHNWIRQSGWFFFFFFFSSNSRQVSDILRMTHPVVWSVQYAFGEQFLRVLLDTANGGLMCLSLFTCAKNRNSKYIIKNNRGQMRTRWSGSTCFRCSSEKQQFDLRVFSWYQSSDQPDSESCPWCFSLQLRMSLKMECLTETVQIKLHFI